jgi:hypothetical protein
MLLNISQTLKTIDSPEAASVDVLIGLASKKGFKILV